MDPLREPWKDPNSAIVIDPYEESIIDWAALATDRRVAAIIHRGTHGAKLDSEYISRRAKVKAAGYLWGSYHLAMPGDPVHQADFYLEQCRPANDEVMALDIESLEPTTNIDLAGAEKFMARVLEKTGRCPMVYGNHTVIRDISAQRDKSSIFGRAPLWYARFRSSIADDFPSRLWERYTLWQFSSEINCSKTAPQKCPYRVAGTDTDIDVNVYPGTVEALRQNWPFRAGAA